MKRTKQEKLTALRETYGTVVTRAQLIEFEQAGHGSCQFIGDLYRTGRGQYTLPAVYDASVEPKKSAPRAKTCLLYTSPSPRD